MSLQAFEHCQVELNCAGLATEGGARLGVLDHVVANGMCFKQMDGGFNNPGFPTFKIESAAQARLETALVQDTRGGTSSSGQCLFVSAGIQAAEHRTALSTVNLALEGRRVR